MRASCTDMGGISAASPGFSRVPVYLNWDGYASVFCNGMIPKAEGLKHTNTSTTSLKACDTTPVRPQGVRPL